jgi:ketosteroid isomerase-like protein
VSQQNVDIVLGLHRPVHNVDLVLLYRDDNLWARASEGAAPYYHPDYESIRQGVPGGKTYIGWNGSRKFFLDWLSPWASYRARVEEAIDCGDRVLVLTLVQGLMQGSTQEVTVANGVVWTVHDGKVARVEYYPTRASALNAVGLEE